MTFTAVLLCPLRVPVIKGTGTDQGETGATAGWPAHDVSDETLEYSTFIGPVPFLLIREIFYNDKMIKKVIIIVPLSVKSIF